MDASGTGAKVQNLKRAGQFEQFHDHRSQDTAQEARTGTGCLHVATLVADNNRYETNLCDNMELMTRAIGNVAEIRTGSQMCCQKHRRVDTSLKNDVCSARWVKLGSWQKEENACQMLRAKEEIAGTKHTSGISRATWQHDVWLFGTATHRYVSARDMDAAMCQFDRVGMAEPGRVHSIVTSYRTCGEDTAGR